MASYRIERFALLVQLHSFAGASAQTSLADTYTPASDPLISLRYILSSNDPMHTQWLKPASCSSGIGSYYEMPWEISVVRGS